MENVKENFRRFRPVDLESRRSQRGKKWKKNSRARHDRFLGFSWRALRIRLLRRVAEMKNLASAAYRGCTSNLRTASLITHSFLKESVPGRLSILPGEESWSDYVESSKMLSC